MNDVSEKLHPEQIDDAEFGFDIDFDQKMLKRVQNGTGAHPRRLTFHIQGEKVVNVFFFEKSTE